MADGAFALRLERSAFLRYALALACVALAVALHLSPAGPFLHPTGLFLICIVAAAWFGGAGPGFVAALLGTFALPQLIPMSYPLVGGFFDLPRFVTFAVTGLAVGWGVTTRRRAEAALRAARSELEGKVGERTRALQVSEDRYALATKASDEGFWDWIVATNDFYASPRMVEMYGFPAGTVFAGRDDFLARFSFHPEDRAKWEQAVAAHFAGKSARFDIEVRMLRGGETRWLHLTGLATRDAAGQVVRWTGATKDVTARKCAEDALRLSGERFALAVAGANDGIWDWDLTTDMAYFSPRAQELLGRKSDGVDLKHKSEWDQWHHYHPDDAPVRAAALREHLEGRTPFYEGEWRVLHPDGTYHWILGRGICERDGAGRPVRFAGSISDIDARKRTEEELKRSEERYALAMQASGEGHWDWKIGSDEYYTSPRHLEILGLPPDTTSKGRKEALEKIPYHPEDRAKYDAAVAAHFAGKTPRVDIQVRLLVRSELRWVHAIGMCLRNAAGVPVRWAGSITDITEQKRAEEALRLSEERYARAMQASNDGLWEWHPASDAMFVSPRARELFGIADGAQISTRADVRAHGSFHPDDLPRIEAAIQAGRSPESGGLDIEYRVLNPAGEVRWIRSRGKVFLDEQGRRALLTGALTDITERKRGELALRASEERYALAMQASGEGHWDWKIASDEFYASPRWLEIAGFAPDEKFKGRADALARYPFHPEDRPKYEAALAAYFAGSTKRFEIELRIRPRGELRWAKFIATCLRDANGTPIRLTGSISDITEKKKAEQALLLSEERYARAMEGSDAGHWDWNIVTDEMFVSERAREMLALPPGPLPARRSEIMALVPQHPDDQERMDEQVLSGIRSASHERDYRVIPRPGEVRWLRSRGKVYKDARGAAVRMTGSLTDITERKLAADALRASEERYSLAMEASEEGHFDWNVRTDEIFVSGHIKKVFNLPLDADYRTRSELVAQVRYHPQDRAWLEELPRSVLAGSALRHEFEYRILRGEEVRWMGTRWKIFRDAAGSALRVIGVVTDVTAQKRAADELRESEARFRALTELSSDWYWRQDENLRFTYVSHQVADTTAYPREWVIGKTRAELPGITPLSFTWAEHQAVLAARQPFRDLEYARVGRDGRAEYVSISGAPIFDSQGSFRGYQGVGHNISERRRFEEELRARQEMLDLAQKSARAVAFEWRIGDGEGENRWSPDLEMMYGLAPGTYDGSYESWKKLVHPDDWPAVKEAVKHAHRTGDVDAEYRVVHPDGSVHWLHAKGRMFFNREAKPVRMVGFMHDVSERRHAEEEFRRMERQLRQAQRLEAMGTLAGGIAHDFNNILGAILGYGEMALRDAAKGSRLRRDLDSIITAGERGRALVDRVLAFSRSGVGERVAVHVEKVVREALDLLSAKLPPNVTLHAKLHAGPAAMLGDATQVHQVLMNLATNAIQAMPAGGTLRVLLDTARIESARTPTIGAIAAADYLVLRVSDTGTGIPPEIVERIFDPFFTTKEVGTGTGLGLSLVHGIVTELGGAIDVASTPGKGSTFTVYLPRNGDAADLGEDEETAMPRGEGQRVLIVDDEEPLVQLATRTLEELGYAPTGFTSSAAALAAFRADPQRFDALITDERMPGLSGSALIREVREIRGHMPIVMMSGYVGAGVASGAAEVLKKPLSARDLATSLARVLHP